MPPDNNLCEGWIVASVSAEGKLVRAIHCWQKLFADHIQGQLKADHHKERHTIVHVFLPKPENDPVVEASN